VDRIKKKKPKLKGGKTNKKKIKSKEKHWGCPRRKHKEKLRVKRRKGTEESVHRQGQKKT